MYNSKEFLDNISKSFRKYIESGPRSNEKLKPIHGFVAKTIKNIFGDDYNVHFLSNDTKEMTVRGKYYDKDIDITVTHDEKPVICLGIKFVTSNYKQNANNYFENMMGETANIQARKDLPYFQLIILRYKTPYYEKTSKRIGLKVPSKIEQINEHDLRKYINLAYDTPQAHKPYAIGIILIDLNERTYNVKELIPQQLFEKDIAQLLEGKLSVRNLFLEIERFYNYLKTKK